MTYSMPNQNTYDQRIHFYNVFMYEFVKHFTLTDGLNYLCLRNLSYYKGGGGEF